MSWSGNIEDGAFQAGISIDRSRSEDTWSFRLESLRTVLRWPRRRFNGDTGSLPMPLSNQLIALHRDYYMARQHAQPRLM